MDLKIEAGQPAPDFLLRDLEGHPHTLGHYHGRITILNFWSAACEWSLKADEQLQAYMQEWEDGINWISIAPNANESVAYLKAVSGERKLPLVLHDVERKVTELYGAEITPHVVVLDREGVIRYQGGFDDRSFRNPDPTRNYLKEAVEALIAGDTPAVDSAPAFGCTIVYYDLD